MNHENQNSLYPCDQCDYKTTDSNSMRTHAESTHKQVQYHQENGLNNSEESYDNFACDICGDLGYNCEDDLIQHNNNMHLNYSCDQCDFVALGQMMMDWHMSTSHIHFSCDECEFIAKNKGGLTRHRNAKHESTPLQNHLNTTTGEDRVEASFLTINFSGNI